jgi:hypothetical protein
VIEFRGVMVCDGAMTSVMPVHAGATHVCAFPASIVPFGRCPQHEIGPDMQVLTSHTHIPPRVLEHCRLSDRTASNGRRMSMILIKG